MTKRLIRIGLAGLVFIGGMSLSPLIAVGAPTCGFDGATGTVTVSVSTGAWPPAVIERSGNAIALDSAPCGAATVSNTDLVVVTGSDVGPDLVWLSIAAGPFAPGRTTEADGSSEIEFSIDLGSGPRDGLKILGTAGNDSIAGGSDGYSLDAAGAGIDPDVSITGAERLIVDLGDGKDRFRADGAIAALGGPARDETFVLGGTKRDVIRLGAARNRVDAGFGADLVIGGPGRSYVFGGSGRDVLVGRGEHDVLDGGHGRDEIFGGPGRDVLEGAQASDHVDGGAGRDVVELGLGPVIVDLSKGFSSGDGRDQLSSIEDVWGSPESDRIFGSSRANAIDGGAGADLIVGGGGGDLLEGRGGDDRLVGGGGADRLFGRYGDDVLSGGPGDDTLGGGPGADLCLQGAGTGPALSCESTS